jgi:hypothetical protein
MNRSKHVRSAIFGLAVVAWMACPYDARGQSSQAVAAKDIDPGVDRDPAKDPPGLRRLAPDGKLWLDAKNKRVVMVGEVCLREGQLEMFACLKGTKEHEAIVAVPTKAFAVHAALIAVGAEPGAAAQFIPKYQPAHGPRVDVTLFWTDAKGERRHATAQDWIRNVKTGKPMSEHWVFGGSGFWKDEATGQQFYKAEDGDFICISNFNSAMLDLPIESSQSNEALLYEAFTDRIPPAGTAVSIVLTPRLENKTSRGAKAPARSAK